LRRKIRETDGVGLIKKPTELKSCLKKKVLETWSVWRERERKKFGAIKIFEGVAPFFSR
jgi:hypothetical protein